MDISVTLRKNCLGIQKPKPYNDQKGEIRLAYVTVTFKFMSTDLKTKTAVLTPSLVAEGVTIPRPRLLVMCGPIEGSLVV